MSAADGPGPLCLNGFNGSPYLGVAEDLPGWIDAAAAAGFAGFGPDRFALEAWLARGETLHGLARRMRDAGLGCGFIAAAAMLGTHDSSAELAWARQAAEALGAHFLQVNVAAATVEARQGAVERACTFLEGSDLRLAIRISALHPARQCQRDGSRSCSMSASIAPAR